MRGNKFLKIIDRIIGSALILFLAMFTRRSKSALLQERQFKRILIIKLAALGDTLLLIPALRAVRKKYQNAHISFIGTSINSDVVKLFPQYVNEFIDFNVKKAVTNPFYLIRFFSELRPKNIVLAIDFEQWSNVTPLLSLFSKAPVRIGFKLPKGKRDGLYTDSVLRDRSKHEAVNFLRLLTLLGIERNQPEIEIPVNGEKVQSFRQQLQQAGWKPPQPIIVIHPGCGKHGFPREWSIRNYKSLCGLLNEKFYPFFIFTAGDGESQLTEELLKAFPYSSLSYSKLELENIIALYSMTNLFISSNNGMMHIAAALKVPQIALHGPTNSVQWGPLNTNAVVIHSTCPDCPSLDFTAPTASVWNKLLSVRSFKRHKNSSLNAIQSIAKNR